MKKIMLILPAILLVACQAPDDGGDNDNLSNGGSPDGGSPIDSPHVEADGPVRATTTCVYDACDDCEASVQESRRLCNSCWNMCPNLYDQVGCINTCQGICARVDPNACTRACSGEQLCREFEVSFTVAGEADTSILDACNAAVAANAYCGEAPLSEGACEHIATVYSRAMKDVFLCDAREGCSETDACPAPTSTALVTWYCAALEDRYGECTGSSALEVALADVGGMLRKDVIASARACEAEGDTDEFSACVEDWFSAVFSY